ncbi:MAG: hypothetical protein AB7G75_19410 [Candidatus Binatia bacterium]
MTKKGWLIVAVLFLFSPIRSDSQTLLNMPPAQIPNFKIVLIPTGVGSYDAEIWFSVDTPNPTGSIYYDFTNTSGVWQYPNASVPTVVSILTNKAELPRGSTVAMGTVLKSVIPQYKDVRNGQYYKYMMYVIAQPPTCAGTFTGFLMVAFSNDGRNWTSLAQVNESGGPTASCWPYLDPTTGEPTGVVHTSTLPVQSVAAIRNPSNDTVYIVALEGRVTGTPGALDNVSNYNRSLTFLYQANRNNPTSVSFLTEISPNGISKPQGNCSTCGSAHSYFVNLDLTYESGSGRIYISRGYPYPFDGTNPYATPCNPVGSGTKAQCAVGIAQFANRVQMYYQVVGPIWNISAIGSGTWTIVGDWGNGSGYPNNSTGSCQQTPLLAGQTNYFNRDYGYLSFRKDGNGYFSIHSAGKLAFLGTAYNGQRSTGTECAITGNEGMYYLWY